MTNCKHPKLTVAAFVADRLACIDKTQREVAAECGFDNPKVISMFKNGTSKIPMNRVGPLARALGADPAYLLRLVLSEYLPDTWDALEDLMQSTVLTSNELKLLRAYREATRNVDPEAHVIKHDSVIAVVAA